MSPSPLLSQPSPRLLPSTSVALQPPCPLPGDPEKMMQCTIFLGFQHFVLFNGLQWELLLIHSREKSFFCCCCCCCCLPPSAWGRSWIMSLMFFLTSGLSCDVPQGPIKSFLAAALQRKAKCWSGRGRGRGRLLWLRELRDIWSRAASHHEGLDKGRTSPKLHRRVRVCWGGWVAYWNKLSDYRAKVWFGFFSFLSCSLSHGISTRVVARELRLQENGHFWPAADCRSFCVLAHKLHTLEPKFSSSCYSCLCLWGRKALVWFPWVTLNIAAFMHFT